MEAGAERIYESDRRKDGFVGRSAVIRKMARDLSEPADRFWSLGNEYATQLHSVDEGVLAVIERADDEIQDNPENKEAFCGFFKAVEHLANVTRDNVQTSQRLIETFVPLEKLSRDLRPPVRRFRQGLTVMMEARGVVNGWTQALSQSSVRCEDVPL